MAYPNVWTNKALVNIQQAANSASIDLHVSTKDIDITFPPRDIDIENNTAGGQVVAIKPDGMYEIKLSGWTNNTYTVDAVYVDSTTAQGTTMAITNPYVTSRLPVRCAIMWTTDAACTSASSSTAATSKSYQLVFVKGYVTSYNTKYTSDDGRKLVDITIKGPAHLSTNGACITANIKDTGSISALSAYTETDI